jgi:hypothetical protein
VPEVASASLGLGLDLLVATMSPRLSPQPRPTSTDLTDRYDIFLADWLNFVNRPAPVRNGPPLSVPTPLSVLPALPVSPGRTRGLEGGTHPTSGA